MIKNQALREIFTQIRVHTGHDFSNYKRPTLLRRLERRVNIHSLPDLSSYARLLQNQPEEIHLLLKDLLISVTNFFRDKKAFDIIEQEVLPVIFKGKTQQDQVRIWVAGCATGEEAYSLAILCAEKIRGAIDAPRVQIFATDIDEASVTQSREGLYTLNDAADVSPERLRQFFVKEGNSFRIRREVRETVMFATHNFLKDPPFSHLDMISCRNVLIYLNQVAQERVTKTFHFALKPGSFLFLGTSESVDDSGDLYVPFNRDNHIFRSRLVAPRSYPVPETAPALFAERIRIQTANSLQENKTLNRISYGDLHQQLLEEYAPPSLIVNEEYEILHLSERAGRYLQIGGGEITQNLLKLIKPELRLELRSALYLATQGQTATESRNLKVIVNDKPEIINIHVRPVLRVSDVAKGFILVVFEPSQQDGESEIQLTSDEPIAQQIEHELIRVKLQLRASNEQHDLQAEEMKASNEELQAMNEELRSSAEELETSKEEMQSINEELRTVNQELKVKIEETSIASNNLQNLINSTDIGTIFLDRGLRVAFFTPAVARIFNLITTDYGRLLTDITHRLDYPHLLTDAETVLEKLNPVEKEVKTVNGDIYLLRITAYRTNEDRIKGVVITFVDVTERRKAENLLRESEENYRLQLELEVAQRTKELNESKNELAQRATDKYMQLFNSIDQGFCIVEVLFDTNDKPYDYRFIEANKAFEKQTGVENAVGKTMREVAPHHEQYWFEIYGRIAKTGQPERFEHAAKALGFHYEVYAFRVDDKSYENSYVAILFNDVSQRIREDELKSYILGFSDAIRPLSDRHSIGNVAMNLLGKQLAANRALYSEIAPDNNTIITRSSYIDEVELFQENVRLSDLVPLLAKKTLAGQTLIINDVEHYPMDETAKAAYRSMQVAAVMTVPLSKDGRVTAVVSVHQKVPRRWTWYEIQLLEEVANRTGAAIERATIEEALRQSEEKYRTLFETMEEGYAVCQAIRNDQGILADYTFIQLNPAFRKLTHLTPVEAIGKRMSEILPGTEEHWLPVFQQVLDNRETIKFERYIAESNKWYVVTAFYYAEEQFATFYDEITERKKAEETLRKSEAQLRALVKNLPGGAVFIVDHHLRFLLAEGEALSATGVDSQDIVGKEIDKMPLPELLKNSGSHFKLALNGKSFEFEHQVNNHTFISRGAPLVNANGDVYAALGISYDITERKKAELALSISEQKLQATMKSAVDFAIITMNNSREVQQWNTGAERILGYSFKEIQGQSADVIFTKEDQAAGMPLQEQETAARQGYAEDERWHQRKDGSLVYMSGVMRPIINAGVTGFVKVARDMTQQKQAEEQIRIFGERNRIALQSAEMAAWDWDVSGDKVVWNEQHYLLFGVQPGPGEHDSSYFLQFIFEDDKELVIKSLTEAIEKTGVYRAEFRIVRMDTQEIRWMSDFGRAIEWENNKALRMVGVMFDITDRKKLEQQKEDFLSIASHELKTPVTSIQAYGELLEDIFEENSDDASVSLLKKMNAQVSRLNTLISDLLDTTKILEGQLSLIQENFDLAELIREVSAEMQQLSSMHKLDLNCSENFVVHADRLRIAQVISNLLSNAIKYSPDGGMILIGCEIFDNYIRVSVTDEGIGIPQEVQNKIFNRFFRVQHATANPMPGMGLGLYISAGIIHRHYGTIGVSSHNRRGSTFYFTLPQSDSLL